MDGVLYSTQIFLGGSKEENFSRISLHDDLVGFTNKSAYHIITKQSYELEDYSTSLTYIFNHSFLKACDTNKILKELNGRFGFTPTSLLVDNQFSNFLTDTKRRTILFEALEHEVIPYYMLMVASDLKNNPLDFKFGFARGYSYLTGVINHPEFSKYCTNRFQLDL